MLACVLIIERKCFTIGVTRGARISRSKHRMELVEMLMSVYLCWAGSIWQDDGCVLFEMWCVGGGWGFSDSVFFVCSLLRSVASFLPAKF